MFVLVLRRDGYFLDQNGLEEYVALIEIIVALNTHGGKDYKAVLNCKTTPPLRRVRKSPAMTYVAELLLTHLRPYSPE
jgi:hypothetical protein